ncbi:RluA family pseudouridine synthase [Carnobacterium gallinarum]|uniref:RluA family pseudouridine synthase n=1 Tax=Carnobacterium gallinarum TaxID=2749 RepID=UPI0005591E22|nr:RluA family pseudouridine synthase [Carnobacterium gallinarum]
MKFSWQYLEKESHQVKQFLRTKGVSRGLLAKIKFQGGKIEVNNQVENAIHYLTYGDQVTITTPDEEGYETTVAVDNPIEIIYEDDHYLIVNKPYGVVSIPSQLSPQQSMANRVKGYYCRQAYIDQVVHIVTRLDRDTTGLMLFAKHGYAHALMDQELREKKLVKRYLALVTGTMDGADHGKIEAPIGRPPDSIIKRIVRSDGKYALTEYWVKKRYSDATLVDIQLHTGRTHQIRVHFAHSGHPLVGDDLYGGVHNQWIQRQALHCQELQFIHPFTQEKMQIKAPYPEDIGHWITAAEM